MLFKLLNAAIRAASHGACDYGIYRKFGASMSELANDVQFVVKAVSSTGGASEFRQNMRPHPLVYQELPHDPHFGIYNGRLRSLSYAHGDAESLYWRLRQQVMLAYW